MAVRVFKSEKRMLEGNERMLEERTLKERMLDEEVIAKLLAVDSAPLRAAIVLLAYPKVSENIRARLRIVPGVVAWPDLPVDEEWLELAQECASKLLSLHDRASKSGRRGTRQTGRSKADPRIRRRTVSNPPTSTRTVSKPTTERCTVSKPTTRRIGKGRGNQSRMIMLRASKPNKRPTTTQEH